MFADPKTLRLKKKNVLTLENVMRSSNMRKYQRYNAFSIFFDKSSELSDGINKYFICFFYNLQSKIVRVEITRIKIPKVQNSKVKISENYNV